MTSSRLLAAVMQLVASRGSTMGAERVPEAGVVNGAPQGMFVSRSLLSGRAVCLLFLSVGRVTRAIPESGLEQFDRARHEAEHSRDTGRWEMRGGRLAIAWGDGGVHEGPPGTITIAGATIVFTADSGAPISHTFLPVAGMPVTAFSIDTNLFTRVQ